MVLRFVVAAIGLWFAACSGEEPAPVSAAADTVDAQADVQEELPPPDAEPEVEPADVPAIDVPLAPPIPCTKNEECATGYCLPTPDGPQCARTCVGDAGCPSGFQCKDIVGGGDTIFACVHPAPYHCQPCHADTDCAGGPAKKGRCVDLGKGSVCLQECGAEGDSCKAAGANCAKLPSGLSVCQPEGGVCPCPTGKTGACLVKNDLGACKGSYVCGGGVPGACAGPQAKAESCDGKDDDCDGQTDEAVAEMPCDLKNVYGTCQGKTLCVGAKTLCQGTQASPEVCNGIDDNCSGATDEGSPDGDGDGKADCLDEDDDGDGIPDGQDGCPLAADASQTDSDKDSQGDACDEDDDGDGVVDAKDDCPLAADASQTDTDKDGAGDACDGDLDGDGLANAADNCALLANADQGDLDSDGMGDACDADLDGDGDPNLSDCAPKQPTISHKATETCNGVDVHTVASFRGFV